MKNRTEKDFLGERMPYVCPNCKKYGNYGSGGNIEVATGNMTSYKYLCRECGHTWGENNYYRGEK